MNWIGKIDKIVLVNLATRTDRLLKCAEQFDEYEIPYERVPAIRDERNGAKGLRDTMLHLFQDAVDENLDNLLVFEDDVKFMVNKETFDITMEAVMNNLPENYIMLFLGCQLTGNATHFYSPNIVAASKIFSTHAVLYSKRGIKEILASEFDYPIDNHYVAKIEPLGGSYCTYPLLCSQQAGKSDIGGQVIDWNPFIVNRYDQKIGELRAR